MLGPHVDVFASGSVFLHSGVVCDGYLPNCEVRVQTHIHSDHMRGFNTSKGLQDIYLSHESYDLLVAEFNADLGVRENLIRIDRGEPCELPSGAILTLVPSNHMLGSSQVMLELPNGRRVGYSGDFGWPVEKVIEVDELVIDSTYGSPRSVRQYSQSDAESCLADLVYQKIRDGSIHIKAHRGTVERVLQVLDGYVDAPIIASERLLGEVRVYQQYGYPGGLLSLGSQEGRLAYQDANSPHIRLYTRGDVFPPEVSGGTSVIISAFMVNSTEPFVKYSKSSYKVALSNHADFNETLLYVESSGAKRIVTDNTRGHGVDLAAEINRQFDGVNAVPSMNRKVRT